MAQDLVIDYFSHQKKNNDILHDGRCIRILVKYYKDNQKDNAVRLSNKIFAIIFG